MPTDELVERARKGVPQWLTVVGAWAWRFVFAAIALYFVGKILSKLLLLVIAVISAMLITALLRPVATRLRRVLPAPLAAFVTLLSAIGAFVGVGYFIVLRAIRGMPTMIDQFTATVQQLRGKVQGLAHDSPQVDRALGSATDWLQQHRSEALDLLTTGGRYTLEALTALVLTAFITFFLLYDAERIWRWLLSRMHGTQFERLDRAGKEAWVSITGYVRGTVAIACIHGTVIGVVLVILGTPLAAPLAMLVFFGSFIPLIGAFIAGGLAVLATFASGGWVPALILFGVLIAENQLEAHVFQPLIMGRSVRLHPLVVGVVVTAGTLVAGIIGALVAVPLAAIVHRAAPVLLGWDDESEAASDQPGG